LKKWTDEFISRALDGIPKDKYRQRAQTELTDHLLALADELEAGGYSPEEAQNRALELMGKPEELAQQYLDAWKKYACSLKYIFPRLKEGVIQLFATCFLCRMLYPLLAVVVFNPLFDDDSSLYRLLFDLICFIDNHIYVFYVLITFLPSLLRYMYVLNHSFALHPHRNRILGISLLSGWTLHCIPLYPLLLSISFWHEPPWVAFADMEVWLDAGFLYLHPEYFIASFLITLMLCLVVSARRPMPGGDFP